MIEIHAGNGLRHVRKCDDSGSERTKENDERNWQSKKEEYIQESKKVSTKNRVRNLILFDPGGYYCGQQRDYGVCT